MQSLATISEGNGRKMVTKSKEIGPSSPSVTLAHDALDRVTNMLDAVGTTTYAYTSGVESVKP